MTTTPAGQAGRGGLRERKKRAMRQQLSDTAARLFLERGFDAVRVADVADACGVSEKTVFNYFPTKEALLLDRLEGMNDSLRVHLANPRLPPVAGMLKVLELELHDLSTSLTAAYDQDAALAAYRRFGDLIREIPSLRAYQSDMADRYVDVAAEVLAARAGLEPTDPEPQIAAAALLGLWRIQFRALRTHLRPGRPVRDIVDIVTGEVRRAALLIENGLAAFLDSDGTGLRGR
jgi:AcrR family transcriptional regulator